MLAPEFLPVWGGVGTYIVELVRHLPRDIEVHVITPKREGFGEEKISTSDYDFSEYFGNNIHVHFVCTASDTFIYNAKFQYACFKHVPKLVKEEQIDLIHSHTAHMPDLLLQFKKLSIPTVTTVHTTIQGQRDGAKKSGTGFWDLEFSEKATRLAYPALRLAEIIYFSRKRYYITVSKWMKNQLQTQVKGMNHSSISVIYNSVDPKQYSPSNIKNPNQRTMVLFTGRIIAAKGIGYLIEAIPKILQRHPDTIFTFIGAGNSVVYKRLLREKGVSEKNYEFLGYLQEASDLVKYYRTSSVYVAPSLYENLPIRVLEAMACGIPVVASNVCGIPECIDNGVNGILIQPGSVDELTNAICSLLSDSSLRKKMGDNARKTVLEKFNWDVNAIKTVEVYRDVLDNFGDQVNLKIGCEVTDRYDN
jgi:glycosyltransferase involved in cell wall biosynthesis